MGLKTQITLLLYIVLQCIVERCSVLQCVAVRGSVLQRDTVCCGVLQCVAMRRSVSYSVEDSRWASDKKYYGALHAVCCSVLQCVALTRSLLQRVAVQESGWTSEFKLPWCVAVCCSVLQCVAVCCRALQCVAVCCSVLQCVAVCGG